MRTRRKFLLIFLASGIAAVLISTLWREREPRYQGKSLSEWIYLLDSTYSPSITNAEQAIQHIGTNSLPFLIKWIQYEEKPWRRHLGDLCDKLPDQLARRLSDGVAGHGFERQQGAFSALYILGPKATPAIPTLASLAKTQPSTLQQSMTALAGIGGDGLTPILHVVTNQASPHRLAAVNAILDADFEAKRPLDPIVISALTDCLTDTNRLLAITAAQILCCHNSQKELATKMLVDVLDDKNFRGTAISRLKISLRLGYSVPALVQFLQDTNSPLSPYAAGALMDLADDGAKLPETVLPALTNSLSDPRPLVRSHAASAVGQFREAAEPAAPALLDLWNDPNSSVRESATNALFALPVYSVLRNFAQWDIGMSEEQVEMYQRRYGIPSHKSALTKLLNDPDIRVREIATNAYRMIRGSNVVNQTSESPSRQP